MCSHSFAPTSSGPGIADLPWVAVTPISLAYSGSICWTVPVPRVARCHAIMKATKITTETMAARKPWRVVMDALSLNILHTRAVGHDTIHFTKRGAFARMMSDAPRMSIV